MKLYVSGGWEYEESYENNYYDEIPEDQLEKLNKIGELSEKLKLAWWDKFIELYPDAETYQERQAAAPYVDEVMGYSLDDAQYRPEKVAQKLGGIWSKYVKANTRCHKKRITTKIYATSKPKIKWIRNSATHYVIDDDRYSGFVEKTRSGWWRVYVTTDNFSELDTSTASLRDAKRMAEEFISEDVESSDTRDRFYYIYELYDEHNEQLDPYEDTYMFDDEDSARKAAQALIDSGEYRRIECVRDKFEYDSNGIGDLIGSDTVFVLSSGANGQHGG